MIERMNEREDEGMGVAAITGRATLLGGTAYGFLTTGGLSLDSGFFRRSMSKMARPGLNNKQIVNPIDRDFGFRGFLDPNKIADHALDDSVQDLFTRVDTSSLGMSLRGGYKGRSKNLGGLVHRLHNELAGYNPEGLRTIMSPEGNFLKIITDKGPMFDIPVVSNQSEIFLGKGIQTKFTARSALAGVTSTGIELEGIDVSLTKGYLKYLPQIMSGEITPAEIKNKIMDQAIYEETRGLKDIGKIKSEAASLQRKEQFSIDPLGELTKEGREHVMDQVYRVPGYAGGNASMAKKGIVATPDSTLSRGMPAAEGSVSSYQIIRQSKFENARETSIKWLKKGNEGLGQFTVATVTDMDSFNRAAAKVGMKIGEFADEEVILNQAENIGIKNRMYTPTIDTNRPQTDFARDLMRDIYNQGEAQGINPRELSKAMTSREGLGNLNLNLNEKLARLKAREAGLGREIDALDSWQTTMMDKGESSSEVEKIRRQIKGKRKGLGSVKKAIQDFGLLGYEPVTGKEVRIAGGDLNNFVKNIRQESGQLTLGIDSHYKTDVLTKFFSGGGGGKWTVKAKADVPMILAHMEAEKILNEYGEVVDPKRLRETFKDVQMISREAPIRVKNGVLPPREGMTATMSYAANVMKTGSPEDIKRLEEIGIKNKEFVGTNLTGKQIIEKITRWNPGKSAEEIFGGEAFMASNVTEMTLAPDISSTQSGIGKAGGLSERAVYNLQAMGLEGMVEDSLSRSTGAITPFDQMREMNEAASMMEDVKAKGNSANEYADKKKLEALFSTDLEERRVAMGGKGRSTINLGKSIDGLDKITVYGSETMSPFIGERAGGGLSELDRASKDLISSVATGQDEAFQSAKVRKYRKAEEEVRENIAKNMYKQRKIKGSMLGQAVSALDGMDVAGAELAKEIGLGDNVGSPLIAMSKKDIEERFGKGSLKHASEGKLWGVMTREPIEGVHSAMPVNIRAAEDFGSLPDGFKSGAVYIPSEGPYKSSMFGDFDKDTVNVIAAQTSKSTQAIEQFYGINGQKQSIMGAEYGKSMKRMASFDLKGRNPLDILSLSNKELVGINTAQKRLEKELIGPFSNEFNNIHIGLREQMTKGMTKGAAEKFYLGEDFSHVFIENILKAKHQGKEALMSRSVEDVLGLFSQEVGTPYAKMGKGERAQELQRVFDEITFGSKEMAAAVRAEDSARISESFAEKIGYAEDLGKARSIENETARLAQTKSIMDKAQAKKDAYKKISSIQNLENVIESHRVGREVQAKGSYALDMAQRNTNWVSSKIGRLKDIAESTSSYMTRGLKKAGLFGILPTMGIGLAASLTTKPKILRPTADTGAKHEKQSPEGLGEATAGRTLFSIPEPAYDSVRVSGRAGSNTNFEALRAQSQQGGRSMGIRLKDHRSHMNKHTVEEMIEKGY